MCRDGGDGMTCSEGWVLDLDMGCSGKNYMYPSRCHTNIHILLPQYCSDQYEARPHVLLFRMKIQKFILQLQLCKI